MIYLIRGDESYLVQKEIAKITSAAKVEPMGLVRFNGCSPTFKMSAFLDELMTFGFFASKKVIVFKDPPFLRAAKKGEAKRIEDSDLRLLSDYVAEPSVDIELIFYEEENHFDSKLKLYKQISDNARTYSFATLKPYQFRKEAGTIIRSKLKNIDEQAVDYLIENGEGKLEKIYRDLDLLSLYEGPYDLNAVRSLIASSLENDIFEFTNAILAKDLPKSNKIFNDLIFQNISVFYIIATLAAQFRFLNQVSYLTAEHYGIEDIMAITKTKSSFRIENAQATLKNFSNADFLALLSELSLLDQQFKTNDVLDLKNRFALFLIKITGV